MKLGKTIKRTLFYGALIATMPKHCSAPVQPMKDRIVSKTLNSLPPKDILVLDGFKKNHVHIDIDFKPDVSHGYLVSKIIEDGLPNANVHKKNIKFSLFSGSEKYMKDCIAAPLLKEMREGKKYDAVNLSIGKEVSFEDVSKMVGERITPQNLALKKRVIKDYLLKNPEKTIATDYYIFETKAKEVTPLIDCMDSLSSRGTKIYVSSGNGGKDKFNLLSLIDNSITVGALDKYNQKTYYSCDHSLVKRWKSGGIPIEKTDFGYRLKFGNSSQDVDKKYTTGLWHVKFGNIRGTSFACPRAIVDDFKNK